MKHLLIVVGVALLAGGPALADWADNFDAYALGTRLDNVGGWFGWDNVPASAGTVSDAQYIPSGLDGLTYFILNNVYNHGGPHQWAIEMHMDPVTGLVNENIHGGTTAPIVYDCWTEIRVEFDLDANTFEAWYNNTSLVSGAWATPTYPTVEFANVDLYAPHAEAVYYDDLSLVPEPASCLLLLAALGLCRRR